MMLLIAAPAGPNPRPADEESRPGLASDPSLVRPADAKAGLPPGPAEEVPRSEIELRQEGPILLVSDVMTAPVLTVRSAATAHEALETMRIRKIQHLVIVNPDGCVEGVLSDRDLRSAQPSLVLVPDGRIREKALSLIRVADVMTREPLTARPGECVVKVLERMLAAKVGSIPVLDDYGRAIGIITGFDVVRLAIRLLGGDDGC